MTLQEFSRDIVPIVQLFFTVLALVSLLLLWWQIRQTTTWNKLNSPRNFADLALVSQIERQLVQAFKAIDIEIRHLNQSLTPAQIERIMNNDDAYFATKSYLGDLENLGAAVSIGALDSELAYAVHSSRLLRAHRVFGTLIGALRTKFDDREIYIELEKTALKWQEKSAYNKKSAIHAGGAKTKV